LRKKTQHRQQHLEICSEHEIKRKRSRKHEKPRNESSISARSWRCPGKHEENTNKEQTARKERDATGMDE
jgi:hypothetical protein